jgi:hypothetical protein
VSHIDRAIIRYLYARSTGAMTHENNVSGGCVSTRGVDERAMLGCMRPRGHRVTTSASAAAHE